jgi:hypothetical protein
VLCGFFLDGGRRKKKTPPPPPEGTAGDTAGMPTFSAP